MTVYIDKDFCCFVQQTEERRAVDVPLLDGKCRTYVEGMRYVPQGEAWCFTDEDGAEHTCMGAALFPWRDALVLEAAQGAYESALAATRAELQPQLDDVLVALAGGVLQ